MRKLFFLSPTLLKFGIVHGGEESTAIGSTCSCRQDLPSPPVSRILNAAAVFLSVSLSPLWSGVENELPIRCFGDIIFFSSLLPFLTYTLCIVQYTAKTQYRKFETNISRKENALPQSQFLHSYFCERFIYSHDRSACLIAYSAAGK
jgi:hypothetical protein